MKKKSPKQLYLHQLEKNSRISSVYRKKMVLVGKNATKEEYMAAYKKNRSLWKQARGVTPGGGRKKQMQALKVTVKDKRILSKQGYSDEEISKIKNHYEAKILIDKNRAAVKKSIKEKKKVKLEKEKSDE